MLDCSYHSQLSAYYDGELAGADATRVHEHLVDCRDCQNELAALRKMSLLFDEKISTEMRPLELSRLHQSLDGLANSRKSPAEADFLRTAGMLSALAASILIISGVWLAEFPSRHAAALSPGVAVVPASDLSGLPDWERTALTLQIAPSSFLQSPGSRNAVDGQFQMPQMGLADSRSVRDIGDAQSVDAQVADWMVAGLSAGGGHANP